MTPTLEKGLAQLAPHLPGSLVLFNLADTKRRNLYLSCERVDQDLAAFDALLHSHAQAPGRACCRIGGDTWLMVLPAGQEPSLQVLCDSFAASQPLEIYLRSRAEKPGQPAVEKTDTVTRVIARNLRAVYTPAASAERLYDTFISLDREELGWAPVGRILSLGQLQQLPHPENFKRWQSLDDGGQTLVCLLCNSQRFDWSGGAYDCAEGHCQTCGAEVDFSWGGLD